MRSFSAFVLFAILALILMIASVAGLSAVCTVDGPAKGSTPIRFEHGLPLEHPQRAALVGVDLTPVQMRSNPLATSWGRHFLCDIKATDVALAGFALFLILALIFQGRWMRHILQATEKSAEATEKSARIVDAALLATQRAYVVFKEFRVNVVRLSSIEDIQSCTIQPVWENSGTTPTRNGRSHINWRYFERAIPADFELADFDEMGNRVMTYDAYAPLVIGPKATSFSPPIALDSSTLRQIREGQGRVLIWGWAEYDDIFPDSPRHRTEFAYQLIVSGTVATTQIGFSQYRRFNGVDEDCERKPTAVARK
jgi:hypothetical protein